jgi:2-keto-4-pentenoate hydratase/2-oxohepta-3-ene-1,7-dioic acid hydratase in catechol pathway
MRDTTTKRAPFPIDVAVAEKRSGHLADRARPSAQALASLTTHQGPIPPAAPSSAESAPHVDLAPAIRKWRRDPTKLTQVTRLNGEEMQRSGTDKLIYTIPWLINYLPRIMPIELGDVIATGTPAGVGHRRSPQLWMKPGDVLEVEISQIGTLRNPIADEGA